MQRTLSTRAIALCRGAARSNVAPLSAVSRVNGVARGVRALAFGDTKVRGVRTLAFGDTKEVVHERSDFPPAKLASILGKDTLAVLGYGPVR
jgi:ketol-acid reductoisomerase